MTVELGKHSYMGKNSGVIYYWQESPEQAVLYVGKYSSIAECVYFFVDNHQYDYVSSHPVSSMPPITYGKSIPSVGNNVTIGRNCMIMSGVKIGDGAVVAPGSVVTKDVEPYAIVGGGPAQLIKFRYPRDIINKLLSIKWWDFDESFIRHTLASVQENINMWIQKCEEHAAAFGNTAKVQLTVDLSDDEQKSQSLSDDQRSQPMTSECLASAKTGTTTSFT